MKKLLTVLAIVSILLVACKKDDKVTAVIVVKDLPADSLKINTLLLNDQVYTFPFERHSSGQFHTSQKKLYFGSFDSIPGMNEFYGVLKTLEPMAPTIKTDFKTIKFESVDIRDYNEFVTNFRLNRWFCHFFNGKNYRKGFSR